MENFEFKSQVCTDKNQSRKLLELGLKKETADMSYISVVINHKVEYMLDCSTPKSIYIPAWSLHRLMEIIQNNEKEISYILDREELTIEWFDDGGWKNKFFRHIENNIYDSMISCIEYMLKEGLINPEYLEKQA